MGLEPTTPRPRTLLSEDVYFDAKGFFGRGEELRQIEEILTLSRSVALGGVFKPKVDKQKHQKMVEYGHEKT